MKNLTTAELKDLIQYHFASSRYKDTGIKKVGLVAAATQLVVNGGASAAAAAADVIVDDFVLSDEDVQESGSESN